MILRILGSAAGGGVPQWNCACSNCQAAREGRAPARTQSGAAVSVDGERWLLLNCSPDIAAQIEAFEPLQPRARRGTPIDGMAFTDANVDHLGGLATLRQTGDHRFIVRSSDIVREIATAQRAFAPFASEPHQWLPVEPDVDCKAVDARDPAGTHLRVRPIEVPGTTPGYDGRRTEAGAVYAYELCDPKGDGPTVLFAPVFAAIDDTLADAIDRCDVAILDGTFYTDDELVAGGMMSKFATDLGHLPVIETLDRLRGIGTRIVFTHLNNSNPMLDPSSEPAQRVREAGAELAYDGMPVSP